MCQQISGYFTCFAKAFASALLRFFRVVFPTQGVSVKLILFITCVVLLSGCTTTNTSLPPKNEPIVEHSDMECAESSDPLNCQNSTISNSDPDLMVEPSSFEEISEAAMASCERAMASGVLETWNDGTFWQAMVPKDQSVDGHSAVWNDLETGEVGLIWETSEFFTCALANDIWLANEFESVLEIDVQQFGNEFTVQSPSDLEQRVTYRVRGGLIYAVLLDEVESIEISYELNLEMVREVITSALEQIQ